MCVALLPLSHCVTALLQGSGAALMLCVALPPLSHYVTAPLQGSGAVVMLWHTSFLSVGNLIQNIL